MDITTNDFFEAIDNLHQQVRSSEAKFDLVVGISRGGLIAATVLSHRLKIPLRVVEWSTRDTGLKLCPEDLTQSVREGKRVLIVDDIIDSGLTIRELTDMWSTDSRTDVSVMCIVYNKSQNIVVPDFYYDVIDRNEDNSWVNFWWEENESNS